MNSFILFFWENPISGGYPRALHCRNAYRASSVTQNELLFYPRIREGLNQATKNAIEEEGIDILRYIFGGGGDDLLGFEVRRFTFLELIQDRLIPIDLHFRGDDAHYQITGTIRTG
ncbi:hypothetical protein BG842_05030 [Haladaptatus sp. W1]|nr:hypothetical protein BG842_05030 [Haladaptatus sp. W1]